MQHLTIMFVVAFFAAADINSAVLMLLNSAWSPRWDITPIVRQDTQKKLGLYLCLRKTSVRKTPLKNKYDYRDKCLCKYGMETSRGHFFSRWANSRGHFLMVITNSAKTVDQPTQGVQGVKEVKTSLVKLTLFSGVRLG